MDDVPMALVNPRVGHFEALATTRERSLVDRAREMDAAAWDELYRLHYGAIQRYALFRLADATAADDIAAEVFLEAVRGIGKYRYRGIAFRAWLYRIAHNLTADFRRRAATRTERETCDEQALARGVRAPHREPRPAQRRPAHAEREHRAHEHELLARQPPAAELDAQGHDAEPEGAQGHVVESAPLERRFRGG